MEEKQLDFNAPLLSVRRFSSTGSSSSPSTSGKSSNKTENSSLFQKSSIPHYKPELKSGPIRNPGAVPFQWEQIPGRPKDEGNSPQFQSPDRPLIAPKLPPGRVLESKHNSPNKEIENPYVTSPNLDIVISDRRKKSFSDDNGTKLESLKEGMKEKDGSDLEEDGEDEFMDAPDTLSRTESFFFNCSISGLSGLDGLNGNSSEMFMPDPQTRDFMMGRFLPAAKAMASDSPQYAPRRQPSEHVFRESPKLPTRVVNADRILRLQYKPYVEPEYNDFLGDEESEDEEDDYDDSEDLSAKACGIFPRFCLRNSFGLLNPVPGMKIRSRALGSSVRRTRTQTISAHSVNQNKNKNEKSSETAYKQKLISSLKRIEDESKLSRESCRTDSQTTDGSLTYGHSWESGISPYRNEANQSPFDEGVGFLGTPKQVKNSKGNSFSTYRKGRHEVISPRSSYQGSGSLSPMVEKTLYMIDTVHVVETQDSNSSFSDAAELKDSMDKGSETEIQSRSTKEIPLAELFLQDIDQDQLDSLKGRGELQPKSEDFGDSDLNRPNHRNNIDNTDAFRKDDSLSDDVGGVLVCSNVPMNGDIKYDKPQALNDGGRGNLSIVPFQSPLDLPLPKSPSESWLWRTLPSVSSRNGAQFSRKQAPRRYSLDPKWETIVKTSNVNHSSTRFPEELKKPVRRQSGS